jgi:hypothetical protein
MRYSACTRGILHLAIALAGCKTELLVPDGGLPDSGPPDSALCLGHHHQETAPLALLEAVDPASGLGSGRAVRVRAGVALRAGCDVPGPIDFAVQPGDATDFVTITAHVWRSDLPDRACGAPRVVSRVVVLSDEKAGVDNEFVSVRDAAPGGTLALRLSTPPQPQTCMPVQPGLDCTQDCQCRAANPAARCIPGVGPTGTCGISCSVDADCPASMFMFCGSAANITPPALCWPLTDVGLVCIDSNCPFGARCNAEVCAPAQTATPETPCSCDADCGYGGVCALNVDLAYCQIPCVTSNDCPHAQLSCVSGECHMLE